MGKVNKRYGNKDDKTRDIKEKLKFYQIIYKSIKKLMVYIVKSLKNGFLLESPIIFSKSSVAKTHWDNCNIPKNIGQCYLQKKGYNDKLIMIQWIKDIWMLLRWKQKMRMSIHCYKRHPVIDDKTTIYNLKYELAYIL